MLIPRSKCCCGRKRQAGHEYCELCEVCLRVMFEHFCPRKIYVGLIQSDGTFPVLVDVVVSKDKLIYQDHFSAPFNQWLVSLSRVYRGVQMGLKALNLHDCKPMCAFCRELFFSELLLLVVPRCFVAVPNESDITLYVQSDVSIIRQSLGPRLRYNRLSGLPNNSESFLIMNSIQGTIERIQEITISRAKSCFERYFGIWRK